MSSVMMLARDRSSPTIMVMKNSAMRRTSQRSGVMARANRWIRRDWKFAKATLCWIASVFGVISPKRSSTGTMISRFTHLLSAPSNRITMAADIAEAATLTSSLPIRIVTINCRGCESRRSIRVARALPARRICSSCNRFREKSAVSELEKNADRPMSTTKTRSSRASVISTVRDPTRLAST